jgi:quinol monooxygenase YgiN
MEDHISWWVELAIEPQALEDYRTLTNEMIQFTRTEIGALIYERFVGADSKTIHVYERYVDSAAAAAHIRSFDALFANRFHGMIERRRFVVFGTPSEELRKLLDRFGATYMAPLGGFAR